MSLFDATFTSKSHEFSPPELEDVFWIPFRVPWIPGGCDLAFPSDTPPWVNRSAAEPVLVQMERLKNKELNCRAKIILSACCCLCVPFFLLPSRESKHQKEMKRLLELLKAALVEEEEEANSIDVRFVSVQRHCHGNNETLKYEDKWLGFARNREAAQRLNNLPHNWLPYENSFFTSCRPLDEADRTY